MSKHIWTLLCRRNEHAPQYINIAHGLLTVFQLRPQAIVWSQRVHPACTFCQQMRGRQGHERRSADRSALSHDYRRWALLGSKAAGLLALPMVEPELRPASEAKTPVLMILAFRVVVVPMSQSGGTTRPDIELIKSTDYSSAPKPKEELTANPASGRMSWSGRTEAPSRG